jgi:hypothetical protein
MSQHCGTTGTCINSQPLARLLCASLFQHTPLDWHSMDTTSSDPKRIERVVLACIQCRSRHVKCDATQPACIRCKRDGKECNYQRSRRGGLDKAALARRRLRIQKEAEHAQPEQMQTQEQGDQDVTPRSGYAQPMESLALNSPSIYDNLLPEPSIDAIQITETLPVGGSPVFLVNNDRLLELYFENFWPSYPIVLPLHYLQQRRMKDGHGMDELLSVLYYIGSMYAPWTSSEPYWQTVLQSLKPSSLAHTPFNVQALMLLAIARYHTNSKQEGQTRLNMAIAIALELRMNERSFAQAYGEMNPVLEESWRRTYYMLNIVDQHLAIISNLPIYTMANFSNMVDLPCDDDKYLTGNIPPATTWSEYEDREFAEIEVVFSSIVYLYDLVKIIQSVMEMFLEVGTFGEAMIEHCDTKLAIWTSLLPACKRDPLQRDGRVDEVIFTANMIANITMNTMHRPFSSLTLCPEEMTTQAFLSPTPFVAPSKNGRGAHTARVLRAMEMQTKLLAIPCTIEKHNVITMCMSAQLAAAQISACTNLLEDRSLSIARDRVRLSIGFLDAMGSVWPLGKMMAKEVRHIARMRLSKDRNTMDMDSVPTDEVELPRDESIWPVDPSAQIDIFSGLTLPIDWETTTFGYSWSSNSSSTL